MNYPQHKCPYCGRTLNTVSSTEIQFDEVIDNGQSAYVFNISDATETNTNFRTTLWTGSYLQLTVMSLKPGEEIGVEVHNDLDQFIRIEEGTGTTYLGYTENELTYTSPVDDDYAIIIPAGIWHNLVNTGDTPLKLYSIYAPPAHPFNTIHVTKEDAEASENMY